MEMHDNSVKNNIFNNSIRAKKLWNVLRIAFFMIRKGTLLSKRKLVMDMNLMMKRGKLLRKNLKSLMTFHHHHHHHHSRNVTKGAGVGAFGTGHYEFSCTNTPNHVSLFNLSKKRNKQHHNHSHYFPCINPQTPGSHYEDGIEDDEVEEEQATSKVVMVPNKMQNKYYYSPEYYSYIDDDIQYYSRNVTTPDDVGPGENKLINTSIVSPFPIRISNYTSSEDEEEEYEEYDSSEVENGDDINNEQVDAAAEDFIRKFYEQLRVQSSITTTSTIGVH